MNTIAADKDGNAFYADISTAPNVDRFQQSVCTPDVEAAGSSRAGLAGQSLLILDGTRSCCEWMVDAASPQPGCCPARACRDCIPQSYVQNSNDSYWLTNPA